MTCKIPMTHEEKEEKLHLIQLDYFHKTESAKLAIAGNLLSAEDYETAIDEFIRKHPRDLVIFLEANYDIEQKYIDEKWEED